MAGYFTPLILIPFSSLTFIRNDHPFWLRMLPCCITTLYVRRVLVHLASPSNRTLRIVADICLSPEHGLWIMDDVLGRLFMYFCCLCMLYI